MANLDREDRRQQRRNSIELKSRPATTVSPPVSDLYSFEKIKNLPPYLQKLLKELATKYAKIRCSIHNLENKLYTIEQNLLQGVLPQYMHFQQKFVNSLEDMNTKTNMIKHLLDTETNKLKTIRNDFQAKYDDRFTEFESFLSDESMYKKHLNELKPLLTILVDDNFHSMQLKAYKDTQKKQAKLQQFMEKKERDEEPTEVSTKDLRKLMKEIETLKINQKNLTKNVKGKEGKNTKKKPTLPKPKKSGEKKASNKSTKPSNTNGKKQNTSIKRRH
jgi:hypothetical protein